MRQLLVGLAVAWLAVGQPVVSESPDERATQHHADVIAAECVVLDSGIGIRGTSASWLQTGTPGSGNPDVRILFDDVEVAAGAYTAANGYQFDFGPIIVTGPGPIEVTARPVAPWDNGVTGGSSSVSVSIEECLPPDTTLPATTTTTTTTTLPITTTTSTTTTTEPPPPPTTKPPVEPPPEPTIKLSCLWDNHDAQTGAHEPILSDWSDLFGINYDDWRFTYVVYDRITGEFVGSAEFGITSAGYHDSWVGGSDTPVPPGGFIVEMLLNDEPWQTLDDPTCVEDVPPPPPPPPPEPPDEGRCVEDDTSSTGSRWIGGPHDGEEALPCTGASDALRGFIAAGFTMLAFGSIGVGSVAVVRRKRLAADEETT